MKKGKFKNWLNEIPEKYHSGVIFLTDNYGFRGNIEYVNPGCGHKSKTTVGSLVKRKQFDYCSHCFQTSEGPYYLKKIPKEYHKYIEFLDDTRNQAAKLIFTNIICNHKSKTNLQSLALRNQFDYCCTCASKHRVMIKDNSVFLQRIPEKYHENIKFLDGYSRDSKVEYKSSKCGHVSLVSLGVLSGRQSFDICPKCLSSIRNKQRTKPIDEYLYFLPEDVKISIDTYIGGQTNIEIRHKVCGHVSKTKLICLSERKQFDYCFNCFQGFLKPGALTKKVMLEYISNYLNNPQIITGYPGNRTTIISGNCKNCDAAVSNSYFNFTHKFGYSEKFRCENCSPKSIKQLELFEFVKLFVPNVENNIRSVINKELDIYCPDQKFAIEFNGLIWHSELYDKDDKYHYEKTKNCLEKKITLLHVWGDKYLEKEDIYKSIIKNKLGVIDNKIFARKTQIKELSKQQIKDFFNKNHLDNNVSNITGWGLFYKDKLVQAMSVRKVNSQNKKYKGFLEIARSATLINYSVVGGESKLLKVVEDYAKNNGYKGILNYVSADFGGEIKQKGNLKYVGITDCSYCYTDGSNRISRQKLQKRPKGKTEKEYAEELGVWRVNLTPNLIYIKEFV